ncbi:hypothetical protein CPB84DRAFT_1746491 [Gymnopilus junonius]|uniref:Uncharacterized protein n=1 Tax=Gymnopilus junonius TaxID=109634 RepID=A0A9P5NRP6_GYMJU|nr:hypothetical protein CPB84DRAFT_1746491 [Gymnopilus junonius]
MTRACTHVKVVWVHKTPVGHTPTSLGYSSSGHTPQRKAATGGVPIVDIAHATLELAGAHEGDRSSEEGAAGLNASNSCLGQGRGMEGHMRQVQRQRWQQPVPQMRATHLWLTLVVREVGVMGMVLEGGVLLWLALAVREADGCIIGLTGACEGHGSSKKECSLLGVREVGCEGRGGRKGVSSSGSLLQQEGRVTKDENPTSSSHSQSSRGRSVEVEEGCRDDGGDDLHPDEEPPPPLTHVCKPPSSRVPLHYPSPDPLTNAHILSLLNIDQWMWESRKTFATSQAFDSLDPVSTPDALLFTLISSPRHLATRLQLCTIIAAWPPTCTVHLPHYGNQKEKEVLLGVPSGVFWDDCRVVQVDSEHYRESTGSSEVLSDALACLIMPECNGLHHQVQKDVIFPEAGDGTLSRILDFIARAVVSGKINTVDKSSITTKSGWLCQSSIMQDILIALPDLIISLLCLSYLLPPRRTRDSS